jgi:hypothetical protein
MFGQASTGLRVRGNLIGSDITGTRALGIANDALNFTAGPLQQARIGGPEAVARNVIVASGFSAISLFCGATNALQGSIVQGNVLGADVTGTRALGNGTHVSANQASGAIQIAGLANCNVTLGGPNPGEANLIAHSRAAGVLIDQARGVRAHFNRFVGNARAVDNVFGGGGIGADANDLDDADTLGGNQQQNFPELALPEGFLPSGASTVNLQYRVDSAVAHAQYPITVVFLRAGEATVLASDTVDAAQAQQMRAFLLASGDGGNVLPLTAVAIDAQGNMSEFAPTLGEGLHADGFESP